MTVLAWRHVDSMNYLYSLGSQDSASQFLGRFSGPVSAAQEGLPRQKPTLLGHEAASICAVTERQRSDSTGLHER
jgi:hypothetical protein